VRSDAFYSATARQIAREYADLPPGPGFDISPPMPASCTLPSLRVDAINWEMAPTQTIPAEGGNLRASTIGYRELALAGVGALHGLQEAHDRLQQQHERLREEWRRERAAHIGNNTGIPPDMCVIGDKSAPTKQRLPLAGLFGVRGVR
jgi:hypothetical protein